MCYSTLRITVPLLHKPPCPLSSKALTWRGPPRLVVAGSTTHAAHPREDSPMSKPVLDLRQHADEAFYALIGRVSLLLVKQHVDAITITMFLRELVEAGGSTLRVEQVMAIAQNYVECATAPPQ